MKKLSIFLVMAACFITLGLVMVSCEDSISINEGGNNYNTDPKTLVFTMPATIFNYGASGFAIGVFPVGTTSAQAINNYLNTAVAGLDNSSPGWSFTNTINSVQLTAPLYTINTGSRWTGSGTYDIYAALNGGGGHYYKISSVNISSAITYIQISNTNEFF